MKPIAERSERLAKALKRAKVAQAAERLRLGPHYVGRGEHVVVDDAGRLYHPDPLSDFWRELCSAAKVRQIRLHDARHSCASIMHAQGVPIAVISAWLGHADPAFTMRTYVHAQNDALKAAAATLQKGCTPPSAGLAETALTGHLHLHQHASTKQWPFPLRAAD